MLYNKLLPIFLFTFAMASTASAGVITNVVLDGVAANGSFSSSPGTANGYLASSLGTVRTFSYVVDQLDLAQDGTADDSVVFGLQVEGFEPPSILSTTPAPAPVSTPAPDDFFGVGSPGPGLGTYISPFESLTVTSLAPIVTLNSGTLLSSTFNGFERFEAITPGSGVPPGSVILSGGTVGGSNSLQADSGLVSFDALSPGPITFAGDPADAELRGVDPFVVGNFSLNFTFDVEQPDAPGEPGTPNGVVPEPGSLAIFGTICLAACGRRRIS